MGDGGRGLDGSTEDQNKFPTAGKGEAGQAAAPDRRSGIAPDSEDSAGILLKFRFVASFTRISTSTNPFHRPGRKGACFHGRAQSFLGTIARGSRRPGLGARGRGGSRRARASDTRRGAGLALRGRSARGLALGYSSPSLLPEVNSTMKARSPPVDGLRERIAAPLEKASAAAAVSFSAALGSGRSSGVAGRGRGAAGRRT